MQSSRRWTRRQVLRGSAGAVLAGGFWPGALRAADAASGEFRFVAINDLHCEDEACGTWLASKVAKQIQAGKEPIDFCLVLGDLVEKGTVREFGFVRDALKAIGLPIHVVPGNHDYAAATGDRKTYDELFPKSLNYHFEHKGWQFVAIDSTQGTQYNNTSVQPATLTWLDTQAPKLDKSKPTVLFTHFPLGTQVRYRPRNAEEVLKRFVDHNLKLAVSGHFHGRTERQVGSTQITTSPCCALKRKNHDGTAEKGCQVYHVKDGNVTSRFAAVATEG